MGCATWYAGSDSGSGLWARFLSRQRPHVPASAANRQTSDPPLVEQLEPRLLLSSYSLTTLASFKLADGSNPQTLLMDGAGNLYGTTEHGGSNNTGTVFKIPTATSTITTLATASGGNAGNLYIPVGLTLDGSGNLYGTSFEGGSNTYGTIFKIAEAGNTLSIVAGFDYTHGADPDASMIFDGSGNLYGTTYNGGSSSAGTVFEIVQPNGADAFSTLASFNVANGSKPQASLVMDPSGNLYGTTSVGGDSGLGTVFEVAKGSNTATALASFNGSNGANPEAGLILDGSGNLYGTTDAGGANNDGTVFKIAKGGGPITPLVSFTGTDGANPDGGLILDDSGHLYGTTFNGGASDNGTVFEIPTGGGTITTLVSFGGSDGANPYSDLIMDANGDLYGTTYNGGPGYMPPNGVGYGTVFELIPAASSHLAFAQEPTLASAGATISPAITVAVEDAGGNVLTGSNPNITLAIATGPSGGVLQGTVTVTAQNGVATFSNVSVNLPGSYTFSAADATDASATSTPITVNHSVGVLPAARIGGLDPSFGMGGLASHAVGFTSTAGVAVQADGKSVIVGAAGSAPSESFGLTRYNADGSLDASFGNNGVVNTAFASADAVPAAVSVLSSGQILVAGTLTTYSNGSATGSQFAVAEYNSDGSLATGFSSGGEAIIPSGGPLFYDTLYSMAVGRDGTIYLAGSTDSNAGKGLDFDITAVAPNGSLETAFGGTGRVLLDFSGGNDSANALAVQSNGEIVAAGSTAAGGIASVVVVRLLPNGSLDPRFGTQGRVVTGVRHVDDEATSLALQSNGAIVVGGLSASGSAAAGTLTSDFLVLRYTSTGRLDHSFHGGSVITSFGQPAAITQVIIQNGQIVASGKTTPSLAGFVPDELQIGLARYTAKGILDPTFNGTGKAVINLSSGNVSSSLQRPSALLRDASDLMQKLNQLINSSQGAVTVNQGGELLDVGNNDANTVEAEIITAGVDLVLGLLSSLPTSAHAGSKGAATVRITESGTQLALATVTIQLELASDAQGDGGTGTQTFSERLNLRHGKSKTYRLKFLYPSGLSGSYYLVATLNVGALRELSPSDLSAASRTAVRIS